MAINLHNFGFKNKEFEFNYSNYNIRYCFAFRFEIFHFNNINWFQNWHFDYYFQINFIRQWAFMDIAINLDHF